LGSDTSGRSVAQISKDIILVFQHPEHMLFEETVMREITFCARAQKIPVDQDIIEKTLKEYHLWDDRDELPVNLPMGKKHLLTILSVLFSSAGVIILDEPTLGMDFEIKEYLEQIIKTLRESGKTVIIISHEIPLVFKVSDEILALSEGKKIFHGPKSDLIKLENVFDEINIPLPPVVRLAKEFDLVGNVFSVADFIEYFKGV
jgi:energy-coupling factor transport system ATP-binding protein